MHLKLNDLSITTVFEHTILISCIHIHDASKQHATSVWLVVRTCISHDHDHYCFNTFSDVLYIHRYN